LASTLIPVRRGGEPRPTDLDGADVGSIGPGTRVPVRSTPHGTFIAQTDLGERDEPAFDGALKQGMQIVLDLIGPRHPSEFVGTAILFGGRSEVLCMARGKGFQAHQRALQYRHVVESAHAASKDTATRFVGGATWRGEAVTRDR
jgi:hypothetical protein